MIETRPVRTRTFNHNLLTPVELVRDDSTGTRFYTDGENRYRSITSVLSGINRDAIAKWRAEVGEKEAVRISSSAALRGTAIHKIAENYILNKEDFLEDNPSHRTQMFSSMQRWIDENVQDVLGVELMMCSKSLNVAGTCDLVCTIDGKPAIVDFKTSSKLKKEEWILSYFLQCTCYAKMLQESYSINAEQFFVVVCVENEKHCQVFQKNVSDFETDLVRVLAKY